MAAGDSDKDKTVIGGALPGVPRPAAPPFPGGDADRTVVGGAMPQAPRPAGAPPPMAPPPPGAAAGQTWIGGALPTPPRPAAAPPAYPPAAAPPPGGQTWIGGAVPTQPRPAAAPAAWGPPPASAPPAEGNTWLGGAVQPQPAAPAWGAPQAPAWGAPAPQAPAWGAPAPQADAWGGGPPMGSPPAPAYGQPGYGQPGFGSQPAYGQPPMGQPGMGQPGMGQAPGGQGQGFFPTAHQPVPEAAPPMQGQRIALQDALRATGITAKSGSNPLVSAAANLLILFGRLRTGLVDMQAMPLMDHVTREIQAFEANAIGAGCDPHEAAVGKYALCATADDIVQNLPGADRGVWEQYSMVARFFNQRNSGVGFFMEAEKAMQVPGQRFNLLELMLTCLSLGFEGQYRAMPNGPNELARVRAAIYETLRRVKPRPDEDVSPVWAAVPMQGRRRFGGVPVWGVAAVALGLVVATWAGLSTLLARDGGQIVHAWTTMHPNVAAITLVRAAPVIEAFVAPQDNTQLDRIRTALQARIDDGSVVIDTRGDYIFIRVGNTLLFNSGKADVKPEFEPLATEIGGMLEAETGPVIVQGFTDNVPMSGRGQFKSNEELSLARATAVSTMLAGYLTDPTRITAEGKGEADPIGDNATSEGQAQNRRVEVLLRKEGTF